MAHWGPISRRCVFPFLLHLGRTARRLSRQSFGSWATSAQAMAQAAM